MVCEWCMCALVFLRASVVREVVDVEGARSPSFCTAALACMMRLNKAQETSDAYAQGDLRCVASKGLHIIQGNGYAKRGDLERRPSSERAP